MSDEQHFGVASVESALGYVPVPKEEPQPIEGPEYEAKRADLFKAGAELLKQREQEAQESEPIVRAYVQTTGPKAGQALPEEEIISLERAGADLTEMREGEAAVEEKLLDNSIAEAIDALRSGEPEAAQQEAPPQSDAIPTPEPIKTTDLDPEVKAALENPKVLNAISEQVAQGTFQTQAAADAFAAATAQNAIAATAALIGQFPELSNLSPEQVPIAIQTLARSNPERAADMVRHIEGVTGMVREAQRAQVARSAIAQHQFQQAARAEDEKWDRWARSQVSEHQLEGIRKETRAMLQEYGLNDRDIQTMWESNPAIRSFAGQRILMDAARWRQAQGAAKTKAVKPVPTVQQPGSPAARGSERDYSLGKLSAELNESKSVKAAAALLSARRARR